MVSRAEFEKSISSETEREKRIVIFGALLGKATGAEIMLVGGSAIAVYTLGEYVSNDIDVIGPKIRIGSVLREWGFQLDEGGERPYWIRNDLKLAIDVLGSRYSGLEGHVQTLKTPYGSVRLAAPEDLIVRRLVFSKRDQKAAMAEAELLMDRFKDILDYGYLEAQAHYEKVEDRYQELLQRSEHYLKSGSSRPSGHKG
jgi:hypothetical protein